MLYLLHSIEMVLKYFAVSGIFVCGGLVASFIVSKYLHKYYYLPALKEDDDIKKELTEGEKYYTKYNEEFSNLNPRVISDEELKSYKELFIKEMTPIGEVIMSYNSDAKWFEYYSNRSTLCTYLSTVARKYIIDHNCLAVLDIDNVEDDTDANYESKKKTETSNEQLSLNSDNADVFAKFKTYNNRSLDNNRQTKEDNSSDNTEKEDNNKSNDTNQLQVRYKCMGKLLDYENMLKDTAEKEETKTLEETGTGWFNLDFSSFKKMTETMDLKNTIPSSNKDL
jgi:hypothetical protein